MQISFAKAASIILVADLCSCHFYLAYAFRDFWRAPANNSIMAGLNAGISSGLRLVTNLPSLTTCSSTHFAPAFIRSVLGEGQDVILRPFTAPALIRVQGARQIAATGLPLLTICLTNSTARGIIRRRSGFITPPGNINAS